MALVAQAAARPGAEVDAVLERLAGQADQLGAQMLARIRAEILPYARTQDEQLLADVADQCLRHARLLPAVLRMRRVPTREELAFARTAAKRRVRDGVPLDAFLHAFRVAHGVMWEAIADELSTTGAGEQLAFPLVSALIEYFDVASMQVAEAYASEQQRVHALADRARRDLVENLLLGRVEPIGRPYPAAPGLDPTGPIAVIVARLAGTRTPEDALQHVADAIAASSRGHTGCALAVARQAEVVALVAAGGSVADGLVRARESLRERRGVEMVAGMSSRVSGFAGVRRGYLEAEHALQRAAITRPIVDVAEIGAFDYLLMSADATTRAVIASRGAGLASLPDGERGIVAETVTALVEEDLSISRAARRLGLHPNTVRYRIDRIIEITGRDPRRFQDALELACVLRVEDAAAAQMR